MAKNKFYQKELVIESIAFEGQSIAHDDGVVVFIKGGAPGDTVLVEILKKKKSFYTGKILKYAFICKILITMLTNIFSI